MQVAASLATLGQLSAGRLIAGVGFGSTRIYAAVGLPAERRAFICTQRKRGRWGLASGRFLAALPPDRLVRALQFLDGPTAELYF